MSPTPGQQSLEELITDIVRRAVHDELTAFFADRPGGSPSKQPRRVAYRVAEVAEMTGLSKSQVYEMVARGEIGSKKSGRSVVIPVAALEEYLRRVR